MVLGSLHQCKNAGDTDSAHSRDWKRRRRRGKESQCQPSPLPPEGVCTAKPSHNLSASSQCQPYAHSHTLPRIGPSHQEHSHHCGTGQGANPTPKSHLSSPLKLKAVHKRGCHHTSERWSKLFSLIKPISSNKSLLLGLNSSELNPRLLSCQPPPISAQRQLLYSYRQHWVNTTTSNHAPGADLQVDIFKANVFPAAVQSPLLTIRSKVPKPPPQGATADTPRWIFCRSGTCTQGKSMILTQLCAFFLLLKKETSPETTWDGRPFHGKFFYNI